MVVSQFEKKLPDPSRKTWDESVSTKPTCTDKGCFRRGHPFFGRATVLPGQDQTDPLAGLYTCNAL